MANLSITEAARAAGVSVSSVRNWMKSEPELARAVTKEKGRYEFSPRALEVLKAVAKRRKEAAPPALRKAWAELSKGKKRKGRGRASKKAGRKGTARKKSAGRSKAAGSRETSSASFDEVADQLQTAIESAAASASHHLLRVLRKTLKGQRDLLDRALAELDKVK